MLKLFGLNGSQLFAKEVAQHMDVQLSTVTERRFDDGEIYIRSDENVRGADVYVLHSLYSDNNLSAGEKLAELLFFLGSLNDASAGRITVVAPYLAYARQDRKTESRAPITTKYVAKLMETAGADRLLTMDVHNLSSFQNAFRIPTDNLEARNLIADYITGIDRDGNKIADVEVDPKRLVVVSPDSGGMSRARHFRMALEKRLNVEISLAYVDKERVSGSEVRGDKIVGEVAGKQAIILDDLISSGSTIKLSADAVERGGGEVYAACATHGLFIGKAHEYLHSIKRLIVTDTIPPFRLKTDGGYPEGLHVISTAKLFGRAISRTHEDGGSISELLRS